MNMCIAVNSKMNMCIAVMAVNVKVELFDMIWDSGDGGGRSVYWFNNPPFPV